MIPHIKSKRAITPTTPPTTPPTIAPVFDDEPPPLELEEFVSAGVVIVAPEGMTEEVDMTVVTSWPLSDV